MAKDIAFSCRCGALQGVLHQKRAGSGCHLVCYCRDCRAYARHMGQLDHLEPGGGSPLYQVLPARIEITQGAEHIACLRLSEKGLHRWYAACCNTPLANTVASARLPLAGMWRPLFADPAALGPVRTRSFTKQALPGEGVPKKDVGLVFMLGSLLGRAIPAWLTGSARINPFFDRSGKRVAVPGILTKAERQAAYTE